MGKLRKLAIEVSLFTVCNITNYFSFVTLYELNVLLNVTSIELTTIKYVAQ